MFKSLTVKPLLWTILALLIALSVLGVLYHARGTELDGMQAKVDAAAKVQAQAEANLEAAVKTNASQKGVINDLALRLSNAIGQKQAVEEINATALASRDAAVAARARAETELRRLKETVYATDATCAAWGNQPVCPAISDQLRLQWDNASTGDRNPVGGSPGAAADPDRTPAAGDSGSGTRADPGDSLGSELQAPGGLLFESAARGHAGPGIVGLSGGGG